MKRYLTIGNRGGWTVKSCCMGLLSLLLCMAPVCFFTSCSSIDEDLSDCGEEFKVEYELHLITNFETELQTQLTSSAEQRVADALRDYLADVFSNVGHDIDLSFFDTGKEADLQHHERHTMEDDKKTYTLVLPVSEYHHIAVANLQDNASVSAAGSDHSNTFTLQQKSGDTVESQETGIFTARTDIDVKANEDQTFHVDLYMANSAVALVIDNTLGVDVKDIQVYATGFATGFNVNDSTYTFVDNPPLIHAQQVTTGTDDMLCFCSVNFPSRDKAEGDEPLWQFVVYVTNADGSVTKSVLTVNEPLGSGDLKVVTAHLQPDGSLQPDSALVGVSITLEWKQGGTYEPEM